MRDTEQLYRSFIENCPDSVLLIDIVGGILSANSAAGRLHGYPVDELLTMGLQELEVSADAQQGIPELIRRFQAAESLRYETVRRRKDGTTFPVEVSAVPLSIGSKVFILAFDRDISERNRIELQTALHREELAQASRLVMLSEIMSGLAHKLNQSLGTLSLYVSSAVEHAVEYDSAALNECLRRVTEQLQRAGETISSKLTFAVRGPSKRDLVDINSLINQVLVLLDSDLKRNGIRTTLDLSANMGLIHTDGVHLQQVLVHLIRNALESMDAAGQGERLLSICTQAFQNEVRVSITDSGCGLDPAIAKRLFVHFQTTKPLGLGLGLAISRNLIEALGGRIGVNSSSASGTTFFFELPRRLDSLLAE